MPRRHTEQALAVTHPDDIVALSTPTFSLIPEQGRRIMEMLEGEIDEWALDQREGRGGKRFTYISHGYVTDQLNHTFGVFWDWELLESGNGKRYDIVEYTETFLNERTHMQDTRTIQEVLVVGRLTIRIFGMNGALLDTISRTGEGGKVRERNTTMADAVQSASSDALKRAAFRLGRKFGLQLYYDDEERQSKWNEKMNPQPPATLPQLVGRLVAEGITDEQWLEWTGVDITQVQERDLAACWARVVEHRQGAQTPTQPT